MSGLAVFGLKFPSLLQFDRSLSEDTIRHNLGTLYGVDNAPSDTYLRERLEEIEPTDLRGAFTEVFSSLQRGKALEKYSFLDDSYLLSVDGTGLFSSKAIHCDNCCEKNHKDGSKTYYHQILGASIVHPDHREVIPICPEPIMKADGDTKNDCERNASKRLLSDFRREHPHLHVTILEDALAANGPHIRTIQELDMKFIIVVKPGGNSSLFEWLNGIDLEEYSFTDKKGHTHKFRFYNGVPLNDANYDLEVNYVEYWEFKKDGDEEKQVYYNTWVTDHFVTRMNVYDISRGGRSRWKIENETFNTLKNQGYYFEHNFGHGHKNLSTVFAMLMMLAFLIDQTQQMCCGLFQAAWGKLESKVRLWERLRGLFLFFLIDSWSDLFNALISGHSGGKLKLNSS